MDFWKVLKWGGPGLFLVVVVAALFAGPSNDQSGSPVGVVTAPPAATNGPKFNF